MNNANSVMEESKEKNGYRLSETAEGLKALVKEVETLRQKVEELENKVGSSDSNG